MNFVLKTEQRMIYNGLVERYCKEVGDDYTNLVSEGTTADVEQYTDTGSYI